MSVRCGSLLIKDASRLLTAYNYRILISISNNTQKSTTSLIDDKQFSNSPGRKTPSDGSTRPGVEKAKGRDGAYSAVAAAADAGRW
jgi:hypothetical protein